MPAACFRTKTIGTPAPSLLYSGPTMPTLSTLDWAVVGLYLLLVLFLGLYAARRRTGGKDFLLGGQSVPWWAATLSIIAAETSAVTYIGTPALAFEGDWWLIQLVVGLVLGRVFLGVCLVPLLYREEVVTVYGLLERRFGNPTRVVTALFFLLGRVVGSGVRLYAGCLAVQVATGLPLNTSVLVLGAIAIAYTLAGGIRSVVWTDVLLGVTFIAGGVISVLCLLAELPEGLQGVLSDPRLAAKTTVVHASWSLSSSHALLAGLAGGFVLTLATHGTDQDVVQRLLSCGSSRGGRFSILGTAALILPVMTLFLVVGTLLYFFYQGRQSGYELPSDPNHIFPVFIVRELPAGISGFVLAGLFAASISSFASVLNALAGTTLTDILGPLRRLFGRPGDSEALLRFSRPMAVVWGLVLLGVAIAFQGSSANVLAVALRVLTYFYGAILGTFLLGAVTRRGRNATVIPGMVLSVILVLGLQLRDFLADLESAPDALRALLVRVPVETRELFLDSVPQVGWPYWIILGTVVTFLVGAIGSRGVIAR